MQMRNQCVHLASATPARLRRFGLRLPSMHQRSALQRAAHPQVALQCFNTALERLKADPRITVRLGEDIRAWGRDSAHRTGRKHIPHQLYRDGAGVEHCVLQFHMGGPAGQALVSADMYRNSSGAWTYTYLVVDVKTNASQGVQRLNIVAPSSAPLGAH